MKRLALITALIVALTPPLAAQSYKAGSRAYMTGDYTTALKHMRPLAKQGNRKAQKAVGWMYANGRGVAQDDVMAFVWFTVAVEQKTVNVTHYSLRCCDYSLPGTDVSLKLQFILKFTVYPDVEITVYPDAEITVYREPMLKFIVYPDVEITVYPDTR